MNVSITKKLAVSSVAVAGLLLAGAAQGTVAELADRGIWYAQSIQTADRGIWYSTPDVESADRGIWYSSPRTVESADRGIWY